MKETRLYKRIACDGTGHLQIAGDRCELTAVNLSKGGACIRVDEPIWSKIEEEPTIEGVLQVDGQDFHFVARVCWSSTAEEKVHFGVAFLESDTHILNDILERLSIVENEPPDLTFNI
jgi:hypothetical protein